jgi:hypothetical protein
LNILFPLRERERAFLQSLFEGGTIDATLADDHNLIEKINTHPPLAVESKAYFRKKTEIEEE